MAAGWLAADWIALASIYGAVLATPVHCTFTDMSYVEACIVNAFLTLVSKRTRAAIATCVALPHIYATVLAPPSLITFTGAADL